MSIRFLLNAAVTAGVLALAGCAAPAGHVADPNAQVGAYRDTIDLTGHLSVNYMRDGKVEPLTGKFEWSQKPGLVDVALLNPLGQTVAEISVTPQAATLNQGNKPPRTAADIDSLTAQALGFPLPVSGLRDWMQGYATDAAGKRFVASPVRNSVVTKDGWRLKFATWQDQAAGATAAPMPQRIDIARGSAANGDALDIHVILDPAG
ncbi:outer membrane lipoprotein LolB [Massilia sp. 9096]|uniref:outer membrane lipoprotein LolB n=1 Tax=Massilia sp. 9096 TaxID=1500894 RepID=UPI00055FE66D|nr:outer membrane lipoprotein LolB [Massilia sp. 9096]